MSSEFTIALYVTSRDLREIMAIKDSRARVANLADFGEYTVEALADAIANYGGYEGWDDSDILPRKVTMTVEMED